MCLHPSSDARTSAKKAEDGPLKTLIRKSRETTGQMVRTSFFSTLEISRRLAAGFRVVFCFLFFNQEN